MGSAEVGWLVVLIGGNSRAGKSTLAAALAQRWNARSVMLDDLVACLDDPAIERFFALSNSAPWKVPLDTFLEACSAASSVVRSEVGQALQASEPTVVEGHWVTPRLAASLRDDPRVRIVFVIESDPEVALAVRRTSRSSSRFANPEREIAFAKLGNEHASWLLNECDLQGVPIVSSQPFATLGDRATVALALR